MEEVSSVSRSLSHSPQATASKGRVLRSSRAGALSHVRQEYLVMSLPSSLLFTFVLALYMSAQTSV